MQKQKRFLERRRMNKLSDPAPFIFNDEKQELEVAGG
jgi:hypothetical protein